MKNILQNLNIGTRLLLGFGIILLFVTLYGAMSFIEARHLWQFTDDLYNHPFQVNKTTRDLKNDIVSIERALKDVALDENLSQEELQAIIHTIDDNETSAYKSFDLVYKDYLGPRADIDSAYNAFKEWKLLRDEVIRLKQNGEIAKAYYKFKIVNLAFRERMFKHIQVMVDYSSAKADEFYFKTREKMNALLIRLWIVLGFIFLLSVLIAYRLIRSIKSPLQTLTQVTDHYRSGNYNARSDYQSANEIGILASAFNNMASTVQQELTLKSNSASIGASMLIENDLRQFCKRLMSTLMSATGCQVAAIYFLNNEKTHFDHYESIGLAADRIRSFSSSTFEGEFGAALSEKKIIGIQHIPEDTAFNFPTVTGVFRPKEIITIPIVDSGEVVAIISLASVLDFSDQSVQLINEIWLMLIARINDVLHFQQIKDYSERLDRQNQYLDEQSKEMMMQSEELKEFNIELELQKNQLNESNQIKSAFLSNMSHELRTPLNSVIGLSGVLKRKFKDRISEEEYNFMEIIEKNGKQLLSLINDILDLSRVEAGKEEVSYTQFTIAGLVEPILNSLFPLIQEKNITVANRIEPDLPMIVSDPVKCHHILQNLISNAVKFTEKGSVEISAEQKGDQICIFVKDTGIGIAAEDITIIFDEFRQADHTASRRFGGTGLGLAIAKKYCQLLNGSISVESQIGVGSVFTLKLPIVPSGNYEIDKGSGMTMAGALSSFSTDSGDTKGFGKTILLVEDSEPAILQITDILNEEGYIYHVARSGKEALETIKTMIPDAIILDLMMPGVDGFEVLKAIRNLMKTIKIPVLILSAKHVTKDELSFLKENQIFQLIRKGDINRNELLVHIQNMVRSPKRGAVETEKNRPVLTGKESNPMLLVIEDNLDNFETVNALLRDKYHIIGAKDGTEGIEKAKTLKPDLILLDISLPGVDGFTVLNELRKNKALQNVPVIVLTARAMKGDREELLNYGFDGYISKPIDTDTFEETIKTWIYGDKNN
jgi:signal transduction histidine kinase/DNA-binding response OmpR family regulator/HAMP domain-containing protein